MVVTFIVPGLAVRVGTRLEPETLSTRVMIFIKGEAVEFRGTPVGSFDGP